LAFFALPKEDILLQRHIMRNNGNAQAALAGLVEKFVGDVLALIQRTAIAEASALAATKVRGGAKGSPRAVARLAPPKKGTGKPGRPPKLTEVERQKLVAKALKAIAKAETGASMKMVQDAIGADIATTKRLLRDLVKSSSVRTTGKTRATAYHPLDAAPPSSSAS
jgi:hypothetical protein